MSGRPGLRLIPGNGDTPRTRPMPFTKHPLPRNNLLPGTQHRIQRSNEFLDVRIPVGFGGGLLLAFCKQVLGNVQRHNDRARYVRLIGMVSLELPDFRIDVSRNAAYALFVLFVYLQGIIAVKNADADGLGHNSYRFMRDWAAGALCVVALPCHILVERFNKGAQVVL